MKRRDFIRNSVCAGVGVSAAGGAIFDLQKILAATKVSANFNDYKALICIFLYGGNDGDNTIVPRGSGYNAYATQRTTLAIPQNEILSINPNNSDGREWGFHPRFNEMRNLFELGKVAVIGNTGSLVVPTTQTQFRNNTVPLPPNLFSHNDQQVQWQTSVPEDINLATGWGGRMCDLIRSSNGTWQNFTSISLGGSNTIGVGEATSLYHVSDQGTLGLNWYDDNPNTTDLKSQAINQILALNNNNEFENEFSDVKKRAIANNRVISQALTSTQPLTTVFPDTHLGKQLKMIARLISARNNLTLQRQVFFCELGGFDTHNEQVTTQPNLLQELSQAVNAFYNATIELGISDKVTSFTASDFGRSYKVNGSGTDHAWGNNQFVIGGAVNGKKIYGQMPVLQVNGPNDTYDNGRWIPTTPVDSYAATLARWFGATSENLTTILPNLGRFASSDMGFMNVPTTIRQSVIGRKK
jgi:uncharacterized protein (DUF1501 family)